MAPMDEKIMFVKGESPEGREKAWDRVYVTTLFSFEWTHAAGGQQERVFVGGIAALLMYDQFRGEPRWGGVRFIKRLLDGPPASALKLSAEES